MTFEETPQGAVAKTMPQVAPTLLTWPGSVTWHRDKLDNSGGRRTMLCTHHPLFSLSAPIAKRDAINDRLQAQLQGRLDNVALWFWGHEHNLALYEAFAGLGRGRCMGAGSVPVEASEPIYTMSTAYPAGTAVPGLIGGDAGPRLRTDTANGLWDLGYGIVRLAGAAGNGAYTNGYIS